MITKRPAIDLVHIIWPLLGALLFGLIGAFISDRWVESLYYHGMDARAVDSGEQRLLFAISTLPYIMPCVGAVLVGYWVHKVEKRKD